MRYLIRSIKYFLYFAAIFVVIMLLLILTGAGDGDLESMFRGGYSALWKIALVFAAVAAFYPKLGFITRDITGSEGQDVRGTARDYMVSHGYIPEKDEADIMTFRKSDTAGRLSRMFEDRITFTMTPEGMKAEGLRKDIVRIASGIEHRLRNEFE